MLTYQSENNYDWETFPGLFNLLEPTTADGIFFSHIRYSIQPITAASADCHLMSMDNRLLSDRRLLGICIKQFCDTGTVCLRKSCWQEQWGIYYRKKAYYVRVRRSKRKDPSSVLQLTPVIHLKQYKSNIQCSGESQYPLNINHVYNNPLQLERPCTPGQVDNMIKKNICTLLSK